MKKSRDASGRRHITIRTRKGQDGNEEAGSDVKGKEVKQGIELNSGFFCRYLSGIIGIQVNKLHVRIICPRCSCHRPAHATLQTAGSEICRKVLWVD